MYTIVNTYPEETVSNVKDIRTAAARVVYEELVKYMEEKKITV